MKLKNITKIDGFYDCMIFSTIVSPLHLKKKNSCHLEWMLYYKPLLLLLLPLLSSSMKCMFEEVYLKHNHKSKKKTQEQSVVFMYLQFNWPCWNFENEKWDILEQKVDDLRIPHQKRAWKSIKQLFLFLTTYSGDQTLCTWKSENMKKKKKKM